MADTELSVTTPVTDWIQKAVERVHNPPAGWAWCRSEVIGERPNHVFVIEGGIPRVLTRGPRKGRRTWKGSELTTYVITPAQLEQERSND